MLFGTLLLTGFGIPLSIDIVLLGIAIFSATEAPQMALPLYIAFFAGCCGSAQIAYWMGRLLGSRLLQLPFFAKIVPKKKIELVQDYFEKYGGWTLFIGRFIPFGIRSCIFWSSGISKMSFAKFAIQDFFSCLVWSSVFFMIYYQIGTFVEELISRFSYGTLIPLLLLKFLVISFIWYKISSKKPQGTPTPVETQPE